MILSGLAKKIVAKGLLSEEATVKALGECQVEDITLVQYLTKANIIDSTQLGLLIANEFGMPFFDLNAFDLDNYLPNLEFKLSLLEKHRMIPLFKRGSRLFIAISDPTNLEAIDDIKFQTSTKPEAIIVEDHKLDHAIRKVISQKEMSSFHGLEDEALNDLDISNEDDAILDGIDLHTTDDETPIVKFVNKMLLDAINCGASDLHFEPYEKTYRIRFRQDGVLIEHATPPSTLASRISTRIKVMSNLDISERRIPQDGRFKLKISKKRSIDFRVSTCPTLFGEKVVMRILDPTSAQMGIEALGYEPFQKKLFLEAIRKPQGMVLVTGPTGSGKTVSLYTALSILNTVEVNISTAEDPVEINLPGINQVNVHPKAGLTFAAALRSFLRQDPDIVMVGEIRDLETAEIAVKAAQTGHMVLSTLHTNSAADTLTRMINMGIPAYNLATSVTLVIAQRLARRLCEKCKIKSDVPKSALLELGFKEEDLEELVVYAPQSCNNCINGYRGRIGIYEVMSMSEAISELILNGANALEIARQAAKEGCWDLRYAGLNKVKAGLTSLDEISRVIKE